MNGENIAGGIQFQDHAPVEGNQGDSPQRKQEPDEKCGIKRLFFSEETRKKRREERGDRHKNSHIGHQRILQCDIFKEKVKRDSGESGSGEKQFIAERCEMNSARHTGERQKSQRKP